MKILLLGLYKIADSNSGYIYADLIKEFAKEGHEVYAVTPTPFKTECLIDSNHATVIKVKNGSTEKVGKIKKVINLFLLDRRTIKAIKKYAKGMVFDYIITMSSNLSFYKTMKYFKKKHCAFSYLLLKDIFPQNALDMGMLKTTGIKGIIYKYFRKKEQKFYQNADKIGCISEANITFLLKHNPEMNPNKVEVCPNSVIPEEIIVSNAEKQQLKEKYHLPLDKMIFVYGGNFGVPQGVPFIIECLKKLQNREDLHFVFLGDGTEFHYLEEFVNQVKPKNITVFKRLPREDFDKMLYSCDVGLIFLDYRFTMPNYPSRALSYMQASLPILAATDTATDIGRNIIEGGFGWWCPSNDVNQFCKLVEQISHEDLTVKKQLSKEYLIHHFSVKKSVEIILKSKKEQE